MSAVSPSQTVFSIDYDFHWHNSDNGNVFAITNNRDANRSQTFSYDALNRLTSAQNTGTDCGRTVIGGDLAYWGNTYTYDAWGNLTNKTKISTACAGENLGVTVLANNRIANAGYDYDAAGNMTTDGTEGVTLTYDPENRITGANGYTYDADGNRVEKSNGSTGTLYWYMTPGIVAESDLSGALKAEYVFFTGDRVARRDFGPTGPTGVFYYFSDHLNTASVITDSAGNIKSDSDYYPWGGELRFIANDPNHYKFTGKERDTETGLDYFGARYYSNGLGRFIMPDWAAKAAAVPYAEFADPQSLNLYRYVRNVPTVRVDTDGHQNVTCYLSCKAHNISNFFKDQNKKAVQALATLTVTVVVKVYTVFHSEDNSKTAPAPQSNPAPGTQTKAGNPARPGTLGKPDHQATVEQERMRIGGKKEVTIPTPDGSKGSRRADAVGTNPETGAPEIVQVYRPTPAGNIPKREVDAAKDIEHATGVKPTMVPVRPLPKKKDSN